MHFLERDALFALGQVGLRGVQAVGDLLRRIAQQRLDVAFQVEHQHPAVDARMPRQRQHRRRTQARGRIAHRHVQHRLHRHRIEQAAAEALVAQLQRVLPQPRLAAAEVPGHADGGIDVGQRFVRIAVAHAVGQCQLLQLERGGAVLALRPDDALRAQRVHQPQHVQQVPARVAVAPLAFVGIVEVAEQAVAHELVVEAQRVVAQRAGLRPRHLLGNACERLGFADALAQGLLRGDAGDEGGDRRGQQVVGRFDEETDRLLDHVEFGISAHRGELRDARAPRIGAEGFQVVEEEAVGHDESNGASQARLGAWGCL
ncbi:hypothetical protein NB706_003062 [Xanthomonas sacchari]|nr:hypothetical protein [Xanthomonas sacchari]